MSDDDGNVVPEGRKNKPISLNAPWVSSLKTCSLFILLSIAGSWFRFQNGLVCPDPPSLLGFLGCESFIPNILGSFFIGLNTVHEELDKRNVNSIVYTTGFCGCLTSFSSWMFHAADGTGPLDTLGFLVHGIVCFAVYLCSYKLSLLVTFKQGILLNCAVGIGCFIVMVFLWNPVVEDMLVIVAPVGAAFRYYFGKLNSRVPKFPVGTFLANITGTLTLSLLRIARDGEYIEDATNTRLVLFFCGSLSTVSSFIKEVYNLEFHNGSIYAITSFIICLSITALLLIII